MENDTQNEPETQEKTNKNLPEWYVELVKAYNAYYGQKRKPKRDTFRNPSLALDTGHPATTYLTKNT